jgi:hypothetical protein
MFGLVLGGLAAMGGAVFTVLNEPVARDRRRSRQVSATLLIISAAVLIIAVLFGLIGSI